MPGMGGRGGTGAGAWLLLAIGVVGAALVAAALLGGPSTQEDGGVGGRVAGGEASADGAGARLEGPAAPATDEASSPDGARAAADEDPTPGTYVVTARDAESGERVLDFWIEHGGAIDLGASAPRTLSRSDPESGIARLERSDPPAPLRVRARRYSVWRGNEPAPPGARVVASLRRSTTIHGFVRDAAGAPMPGARIVFEHFGEGPAGLASDAEVVPHSGPQIRFADERGAYELSGLAPGVWRTRVPWIREASVTPKQLLRPGDWVVADHWLGARTRIVASVVPTGAADVNRSRVIVQRIDASDPEATTGDEDSWGSLVASGYTDETGTVTLGPLPAGSYRVFVQSERGEASPREIDVETSSPASVTMRFELGSSGGG